MKDLPWNEDQIPNWWKRHWHDRITDLIDQHEPDFLYSDGSLPFEEYGYSVVVPPLQHERPRSGGATRGGVLLEARPRQRERRLRPRPRARRPGRHPGPALADRHLHRRLALPARGQQYKTPKMVIDMLVDIVSKNGNLMLNVPLPASGMPDPQELAVVEGITAMDGAELRGNPWDAAMEEVWRGRAGADGRARARRVQRELPAGARARRTSASPRRATSSTPLSWEGPRREPSSARWRAETELEGGQDHLGRGPRARCQGDVEPGRRWALDRHPGRPSRGPRGRLPHPRRPGVGLPARGRFVVAEKRHLGECSCGV